VQAARLADSGAGVIGEIGGYFDADVAIAAVGAVPITLIFVILSAAKDLP